MKKHTGAIPASRLMRWGGVTLLLFIVWHLLNFTVGKVNVQGGATNDPYDLLVDSFEVWWLTADLPGRHGDARRAPAPRHLERLPDPRPHEHRARAHAGQALRRSSSP